jgi:hypothetical protein
MRKPILTLLLLAGLTVPLTAQPQQVGRFQLQSHFWVNLHQTLLAAAQQGGVENPGEGEAERTWEDAVAEYGRRFGDRSPVHDRELVGINDTLTAADPTAPVVALPGDLQAVLAGVADLYRQRRWPSDDRVNRFWWTIATALLGDAGEELVREHERVHGAAYPARIVVDVSAFGGRFGAYTTVYDGFVHTTVSSRDPSYQGFRALEMTLHEASHSVDATIAEGIRRAADAAGVEVPPDLWHGVLFHTSGELTRRALAARGVADYHPVSAEILETGFLRRYRTVLETHWQSYLDGELSREEAFTRMVTAAARSGGS